MRVISHTRADALQGLRAVHEARSRLEADQPVVVDKAQYSQPAGKGKRMAGLARRLDAAVAAHFRRPVAAHAARAADREFFAVGERFRAVREDHVSVAVPVARDSAQLRAGDIELEALR